MRNRRSGVLFCPDLVMHGHSEAPHNPPEAARSSRLLFYKQPVFLNLLESTLLQVFILSNLKSFRINTYAKPQGGGACLFPPSHPSFTPKETLSIQRSPFFRIFFQVPYPLSSFFSHSSKNCRGGMGFFPNWTVPGPPQKAGPTR
jgi:hypothetical protein